MGQRLEEPCMGGIICRSDEEERNGVDIITGVFYFWGLFECKGCFWLFFGRIRSRNGNGSVFMRGLMRRNRDGGFCCSFWMRISIVSGIISIFLACC